ncbi:Uncharacterized protein APZ42_024283 [Daphnia magna]|uniref:Uncharacterized protein n=1 Tax=Daphnia magna TaxID=35525 RepID=A0A164ULR9_9CRUS|nr:Uncharacterized protein APZ42_024283 [Daphnia magna]
MVLKRAENKVSVFHACDVFDKEMSPSISTNSDFSRRELYFDPRADEPKADDYWITYDQLPKIMLHLSETEEKIQNASVYSNPLPSKQLTNGKLYHVFIVVEILNWWWSIEKNTQHITIQRSQKLESVRDMYQRKKRTTGLTPWKGIRKIKTTQGDNITIKQLINYMWRRDCLSGDHYVLAANSQKFADLLFKRIESFNEQVYFDEAADQPRSSSISCYMNVDRVLSEVQRKCDPETLTKLELYKSEEFRVPWFVMDPLFLLGFSIVVIGYILVKHAPNNSPLILIFFLSSFLFLNFQYKTIFLAVAAISVAIFCFRTGFSELSIFPGNIIFFGVLMVLFFFLTITNSKKNGHSFYPTCYLLICETNKTYWSFEQVRSFSKQLNNEYVIVIQRARNKDVLLNKHQRNPREIKFTKQHLVDTAVAVRQNVIAILEFILKKEYVDFEDYPQDLTLAPSTNLAQILCNNFKASSISLV